MTFVALKTVPLGSEEDDEKSKPTPEHANRGVRTHEHEREEFQGFPKYELVHG